MSHARPLIAHNARSFGRGPSRIVAAAKAPAPVSEDFKLFATTFLAGFVFVSMLLA